MSSSFNTPFEKIRENGELKRKREGVTRRNCPKGQYLKIADFTKDNGTLMTSTICYCMEQLAKVDADLRKQEMKA